jgi:predicted DNA-binding transcriptional regulator AlpA
MITMGRRTRRRARTAPRDAQLLKARDVAHMLGLEVGTVIDHAQNGDLPCFRLYGRKGGPLRFRRSEIEAIVETWRIAAGDGTPTILRPFDRERE